MATSRASRSRRSSRPSGDEREAAILTTAERLLAERPLADISIEDLAAGAGISRPTFYFYFSSKKDVLLSLLDRVAEEADRAIVPRPPSPIADRAAFWRDVLTAFFAAFGAHRAVSAAADAARADDPEIAALWSRLMTGWVERDAAVIEAERAAGAAPDGPPARELATALSLMVERSMIALFTGREPAVGEDLLVETLLHVVLGAIYTPAPW
ncbi:TetR/AcrR family transcriptional regulator [Actinomadura logoneensis]|uniref:TetR/AcrR family transcriptional regulator n=1 Tax=Actinomadura logoneensis TaxID=2293572 RepID=A0A372JTN1_9ACTN|nr:TetR/AcrR family transcriptional regulator [Actinomadura logoneensis]RFU43114.1 TetR/AcrR family transcriptional regulator [Actinomadura logoneensis]